MTHHLDSETMRQRWPQLAQNLLDASRTNLSREELFSVLAMLQAQPLRLVVEPLSQNVGAQTHFWPRSRPIPGGTVLVEGPLDTARGFQAAIGGPWHKCCDSSHTIRWHCLIQNSPLGLGC